MATMMKLTHWKGTLSGFITLEATKLVQWLLWSHGFDLGFAAMRLYFCENLVTSFGICR